MMPHSGNAITLGAATGGLLAAGAAGVLVLRARIRNQAAARARG